MIKKYIYCDVLFVLCLNVFECIDDDRDALFSRVASRVVVVRARFVYYVVFVFVFVF